MKENLSIYKKFFLEPTSITALAFITFFLLVGLFKVAAFLGIFYVVFAFNLLRSKSYKAYIAHKERELERAENDKLLAIFPQEIKTKITKMTEISQDVFIFLVEKKEESFLVEEQKKLMDDLLSKYFFLQKTSIDYKNYLEKNTIDKINFEIYYQKRDIKAMFQKLSGNNDLDAYHKAMINKTLMLKNIEILEERKDNLQKIIDLKDSIDIKAKTTENLFYLASEKIISNQSVNEIKEDMNILIKKIDETQKMVAKTRIEIKSLHLNT